MTPAEADAALAKLRKTANELRSTPVNMDGDETMDGEDTPT